MKNVLILLRIPFSLFLMPVYWFALSQAPVFDWKLALGVFVLLHGLIYPASNAYNSYYDKDESPIGGLENPPPVSKALYYTAWGLDLLAIILAYWWSGWVLALALWIYSTVSKAYSNDKIRLKKYPILSWLVVGIFQGGFVYLSIMQALGNLSLTDLGQQQYWLPALLSTLNLLGFYPMTQIYQHKEDAQRGDLTMSRLLGIRGTFVFTALVFALVSGGFYLFFQEKQLLGYPTFVWYVLFLSPVLLFFHVWLIKVWKNPAEANFKNTMLLNVSGAICLNLFFMFIFLEKNF